jgi:hypothetical protein
VGLAIAPFINFSQNNYGTEQLDSTAIVNQPWFGPTRSIPCEASDLKLFLADVNSV